MKRSLPYLAIIVAMLIWSASGIAIKRALFLFRPLTLIILRFSIAVVLMLCVGLIARRGTKLQGLAIRGIRKKDLPLFALAGLFNPFLYYIFETFAYKQLASPTVAEALLSTSPLLAPVVAMVMIREKVTRNNILGILISTVGMFLLVLGGAQSVFAIGNPWGIVCAFVAVVMAVMYTVVLKKIPDRYSSIEVVFYVELFALLPFYVLWSFVEIPVCLREGWLLPDTAPAMGFAAAAYLAVLASVVAYICYCYSVRRIGVTTSNAFNNARPVFTALIMFAFFSEHLPFAKWAGILLIIVGLFVCQAPGAGHSTD